MADFLIKAALIAFGFVPLSVLVTLFIVGCIVGMMEEERKRETEVPR